MFQRIVEKKQKETNKILRKATIVLTRAINKQIREVKAKRVHDQVAKKK
jgi:hypothetical protein